MREFDAFTTLEDSAQVFHFRKIGSCYAACVDGRILTECDEDEFACRYFDDERDYQSLSKREGLKANVLRAVTLLPGLRVVNQPAWEALCAFILSSNNNVKRIRASIERLNENYGYSLKFMGEKLYGFPDAFYLSKVDPDELQKTIRCGYRAKYLVESAKMIKAGFPLEDLRNAPYEEARRELMKLSGVGGKVSDCICLFGLGHASAFPVDVWVKRLMKSWFDVDGSNEFVRKEAIRIFGPECGIYQQSLFHAARTGLIEIEE